MPLIQTCARSVYCRPARLHGHPYSQSNPAPPSPRVHESTPSCASSPGSRCLCKCDCMLASFHPSASRPITSCRILQPFTGLPLQRPSEYTLDSGQPHCWIAAILLPYFCHTLRPDYHSRFSRLASCHSVICHPAPGFCSVSSSVWRSRARLFPADITPAHRAAVCCLSRSH